MVFLLFSCNKPFKDCFKEAGDIDSATYSFSEFNIVNVDDIFEVYLKQDTFFSIKIKTNKTLLSNVKVNETDTAINISDENMCYFARNYDLKINIYITAPDLKEINFYSSSTLYTLDTVNYERFMFRAYGKLAFADIQVNCSDHFFLSLWNVSGKIRVAGNATFFQVLDHGNSYIHAFELYSKFVSVEQRSTADIELTAIKSLKADVFDVGSIYFQGNPKLDTNIYGNGKIIKVN